MEENRQILVNQIRTPDGTILVSRHRHDYVTYLDKNCYDYMVDGGLDYLRRNVCKEFPYEELSIYDDAPFELIRQHFCRGGRGKDGLQPLTWVPLCKMNNDWLANCVSYNESLGLDQGVASTQYKRELDYRELNNIYIPD